jgi:hypothetical protein
MNLREFKEQFGIGTIQVCEDIDKIIGVSKLGVDDTFYALDVDVSDIPDNSNVFTHLDIFVDSDYLYEVDSVSQNDTIYYASASLDTMVLGFEEVFNV